MYDNDGGFGYVAACFSSAYATVCEFFGYKASRADPDTLTYDEAIASPERAEWMQAAAEEIAQLEAKDTFEEVPISTATGRILPGTWAFKRKRRPDGTVKKFKGRFCVRGDLQEGDVETYAPVVHFGTLRFFLVLALVLGWVTCTLDFANAFVQAELDSPIFVHLPRGFRSSTGEATCLRLRKSLYGLANAPRLWYLHLFKTLIEDGFKQSKEDECLLYKKDMIVICYVDDLAVAAPNKELIQQFANRLRDKGFDLTQDESFSEYLGISIERDGNNTFTLTQSGLIEKILSATGLEDCSPNRVPATQLALATDPTGEEMSETWSYPSVIGMLLYLASNTRPDIAFAVSQVARFSSAP